MQDKPNSRTMPPGVLFEADRFEQSPFFNCYANPQTLLGMVAGRYFVDDNGEDLTAAYWALRRQAALFDVPEKPWQIEGPDTVALLERVFSRPVASLKEGRGRYLVACTPDGGVYMDGILFKLGENRYWFVQPDGAFEEWMLAHKGGYDVQVSDPKSRVLQLQGPKSLQIMSAITNGAIDEQLGYFGSGFFDIGGQRLYVSRTGWTGELGYEIYTDGDNTDCPKLWEDLMQAGKQHGMLFGSMSVMGIRRIEAGILDNLSDFDPTMTPFQAGLGAFVDLDKADFIGRPALLEADRESLLLGISCAACRPARNAGVYDAGQRVGRITASAWSPFLDKGIGYVRFEQSGNWVGRQLSLETGAGSFADCEITTLPFYDAEKRIPRTIPAAE